MAVGNNTKKESFSIYLQELKNHLRTMLLNCAQKNQLNELHDYPDCVSKEEQGYLSFHLVVAPSSSLSRPDNFRPVPSTRTRKRFRGSDPTEKQGGDPISNLQHRISKSGQPFWSIPEVEASLDKSPTADRSTWFRHQTAATEEPTNVHVVVSRRPFYVKAMYTKSRRDVSQTPFYVPHNGGMKRLGVTSVDEQITSVLAAFSGGISKHNNNGNDDDDIVYGMAKFHASGREDMDVRMLLPPEPRPPGVGGRPFVCEVIDALRLPSREDLAKVVQTINQTTTPHHAHRDRYGDNEMGVGISACLCFAPSASFKNLQADTEEKVKYYGCRCWSKNPIPSEQYLLEKLAHCPIPLEQRTPLRVLHRRSNNTRTRRVLSLRVTRIDDHYFRLNISTEAGTYVKEFVHGDLGRTVPSVSSLLACKTDILELDCEGIKL